MKKIYSLSFLVIFLLASKYSFAQPTGWSSVQTFTVTNNTSSLVTNHQLRMVINTAALVSANQMQASGADMRFGKDCGGTTLYPHWIDSGMNSTSTVVWVKIDSLPAAGTRVIYMYYGNGTAASTSTLSIFSGPFSSTNQVSPTSTNTVSNCQRGFRFSPNQSILVTDFGKKTPDATTRFVTLFDFSSQAIVRQHQVPGAAAVYSYAALPSHVWLNQGQQYVLELYNNTGDQYYYGTTSQINSLLTYYDMRYCNSCTQNTFPTTVLTNYHYGVPDFQFYTRSNVTPAPTYTSGGVGSNVSFATHPANQTACANSPLNISATTTPALFSGFQWQVNTGTGWTNLSNGATYSGVTTNVLTISNPTLAMSGYQYRTGVSSSCGGSSSANYSNAATLTVIATQGTPVANITASPSNVGCIGSTFNFNSSIVNGSNNPSYQWQVNGSNVGSGMSSYTSSNLNNGDVVTMILSTSYGCVNPPKDTSNSISMVLTTPVTPAVSMAATPAVTNICSGTPITFVATPTNGGTTPNYQWQINGQNVGNNNDTFISTSLGNNDAVRVILTSSINCVTQQSDTSTIINYYVVPSVTPNISITSNTPNNSACKNQTVHFSATISNQGLNPVLQWTVNGNYVGANNLDYYTNTLNTGDIVACMLTSDAMCRTKNLDTSNLISMVITNPPTPTIIKSGNVLSTSAVYSSYQWYFNGGAIQGATAATYTVTQPGNYWVEVSDNNGCKGVASPFWIPYVLGVSQVNGNKGILLYPNPTSASVYIQSPETVDVKVINRLGQMVIQQKNAKEVAMDALADGIYIFELRSKEGELLHRQNVTKGSK